MKKLIMVLIVFVTISLKQVFAQYHEIKAGTEVPNFVFPDTYNFKNDTVKVSDYKGKLLILDFWGPWCAPCIEAFPYLDSLQKEFKDRIQILTASNLTKKEMEKYFKTHFRVFKPAVPFLTNAKFLDTVFPHNGVPFQVWIASNGKVLLYGNPNDLTRDNLSKTLEIGDAKYRVASKSFYSSVIDPKWKKLVVYSSTISRFKIDTVLHPDLSPAGKQLSESGPIPELYKRAFSDSNYKYLDVFKPGRIFLDVKDPNVYQMNASFHGERAIAWDEKNRYTYQLTEPLDFEGDMYKKMKADLDDYFQLISKVEKLPRKVYVLIDKGNFENFRSKGGQPKNNFYSMNSIKSIEYTAKRYLKNQSFQYFTSAVKRFVEYGLKMPFIDETGFTGNVDLDMDGDVLDQMDLQKWKAALAKYHLDLVEAERVIDVLVISDKK